MVPLDPVFTHRCSDEFAPVETVEIVGGDGFGGKVVEDQATHLRCGGGVVRTARQIVPLARVCFDIEKLWVAAVDVVVFVAALAHHDAGRAHGLMGVGEDVAIAGVIVEQGQEAGAVVG